MSDKFVFMVSTAKGWQGEDDETAITITNTMLNKGVEISKITLEKYKVMIHFKKIYSFLFD